MKTNRTLAILGAVTALGALALLSPQASAVTKYWGVNSGTGTWDTTSTNWQLPNPAPFSPTLTYSDTVDAVIFDRDTLNPSTVNVQAGGVTPLSLQIDTGVNWTFQGGKINAFLDHRDTSGGSTSLTFPYDSSPGFTGADIRAGICNWILSSAAVAGNYTFLTGGVGDIELANSPVGGAPGFNMNVAAAATGNYVVTDDFVVTDTNNGGVLNATVASNRTVTYAGDIDLQQRLGSNVHSAAFTGTLTFAGNRIIECQSSSEGVTLDFSGATLAGGGISDLTLQTSNGNHRGFKLPAAGARLNVRNLSVTQAYVTIDAANPAEDYFATLRNNGGRVTISGASINQSPAYPTRFLSGVFDAGVIDFATGQACGFDVTVGADATIRFTPGPAGSFGDGIDLRSTGNGGDLTAVSGAAIQIVMGAGMAPGTYRLFDMDSLTGSFAFILDPVIQEATLDQHATYIDLVVSRIPEPAGGLLAALAGLAALRRRR